ncbi:hypothetical protein MESS4_30024 [Mesorhizobium sp. STM 4661]|nr:hypothetical protein MESS4_30024 [Mesorhizobium sp. STM 4661]
MDFSPFRRTPGSLIVTFKALVAIRFDDQLKVGHQIRQIYVILINGDANVASLGIIRHDASHDGQCAFVSTP